MKIRILGMVLAAALLVLAACGDADSGGGGAPDTIQPGEVTNGTGGDDGDEVVDVHTVLARLPEADFGGYNFRIWTTNWFNATLEGRQAPEEQETGEPVNDALFRRDRLIEAKYNINIVYTLFDESGPLLSTARNSVRAGSDDFDMGMCMMMVFVRGLAEDGAIINFFDMPNIDLGNPWWSQYAQRDLVIANRFYFPTGDITARYVGSQYLMLFNKRLFADHGMDYPYQLVLDGEWTIDAFEGMIRGKTRDLNGDGVIDRYDFFGAVFEPMVSYSFLHGAGESMIRIVDGSPELNITERAMVIMDRIADILGSDDVWLPRDWATYDEVPIFVEDRALFAAMTGTNLLLYRDMESNFGILPVPKWDAAQERHYSFCQSWGSAAVAVPQTNPDLERTGMVIEALGAASQHLVTPAVYEITFRYKYARSEQSVKMLDIIVAGSRFSFMYKYNWGSMYSTFESTVRNGDSFIPRIEALYDRAMLQMENTIVTYEGRE